MSEKFYKNYNLFTHVKDSSIRSWNQIVTFFTILRDLNKVEANKYLTEAGSRKDPVFRQLVECVGSLGFDETKRLVICGRSD